MISQNRRRNRKSFKKAKPEMNSLIERDEYFGFMAGYTPWSSSGLVQGEKVSLRLASNVLKNIDNEIVACNERIIKIRQYEFT